MCLFTNLKDNVVWCCCCDKVITSHLHLLNVIQYQVAANPHVKSTDLGHDCTCRLLLSAPTIAIVLVNQKVGAHITIAG